MKPQLTINQFGTKFWKLNNLLHRMDGPAIIYSDGTKFWCINGENYPQKTWFNTIIKRYLK